MATKELRERRHNYKAAYTKYMLCVQAISDASERGQWPDARTIEGEHAAFTELALMRHELLEALKEYGLRGNNG